MTPLALPGFDLIALVVSTAILSLAVAFVDVLVAQALDQPYRLRKQAVQARTKLRALPGTAAALRAARPRLTTGSELDLPGAA